MIRNLQEFLRKNMELAINDYQMISPGDHILVALSGGDDSYALMKLFTLKKVYIPEDITLFAVHIDLGFSENNVEHLQNMESFLSKLGIKYVIDRTNIGRIAHAESNSVNPCFLCSKLRRKRFLELAEKYHCNKIAFGHHKDDIVETLLINIFFGREISTMKPKQDLFKGKFHIIRPLAYLWEHVIKEYARQQAFPSFENECPTSMTSKRKLVKDILSELEQNNENIKENIYKAMKHVKTDYLL